jgi:hypothetical protein
MARVEIDLENVFPHWETLPDGRHVIVLDDRVHQAVLILPDHDGWLAAYRLGLAADKISGEVRAAERGEVHHPRGVVIVAPAGEWPA